MANLTWKCLVKGLGMMCTKPDVSLLVPLCMQNCWALFLEKDNSGCLSPTEHSHTHPPVAIIWVVWIMTQNKWRTPWKQEWTVPNHSLQTLLYFFPWRVLLLLLLKWLAHIILEALDILGKCHPASEPIRHYSVYEFLRAHRSKRYCPK